MKQLYIKIGQDKIFSRLASGTNIPEILRKNDFVYKLHNAELIYIYDEDETKLYTTKIDDKGKYKTPILVDDESIFDFHPAKVRFDTTDRKNWKLSTQSRHSDMTTTTYYMSDSNYNVNNGVSWMKISWNGLTELPILYGSYAESNCDYMQVWQMDREITDFSNKSTYSNTSTSITSTYPLLTTYNKQNSSAPNLSYTFTCDNGEHFVWVSYRKDVSVNSGEDRGYIGIATELSSEYCSINVPYYTISKDEYIQENGRYYEKLIYSEDGSSRKGNEYVKQLSETESVITLEDGTYKCNYYVITLYGGKVVNTDEYVLGEKIIDVSRNSYVYIDGAKSVGWETDVYPSKDTWMEVYVHRIQGNGGTNVGCVGLSDSADWRMFIYQGSSIYFDCHDGRIYGSISSSVNTDNLLYIKCTNYQEYRLYVYDMNKNSQILSKSGSINNFSGTKSKPICIHGGDSANGSSSVVGCSGYYHRIRIYEGDEMIRDYAPYRLENGSYCLKDKLSGKLLQPTSGSANTGYIEDGYFAPYQS